MELLFYNRHCMKCGISTGNKGSILSDEETLLESFQTEEAASSYIYDFLIETNNMCEHCGYNQWHVYNISINNKRLKRESEITLEQFVKQDNFELDLSFAGHLHQYFLEGEPKSEFYNSLIGGKTISQSLIKETENILKKFKDLFYLNGNALQAFRKIIESDFKQRNFGLPKMANDFETIALNENSFQPNDELIIEFGVKRNQYRDVQSLHLLVSKGYFWTLQFITSNIHDSHTFVRYDGNFISDSYYITIFNDLQIKFWPIATDGNIYHVKITQDLLPY